VAASGKKVFVGDAARVTLATFKRKEGELFTPGGFIWVRDDVEGITWETEVEGPEHISAYHERTGKSDEFRFKAHNGSKKGRTIDWATLAGPARVRSQHGKVRDSLPCLSANSLGRGLAARNLRTGDPRRCASPAAKGRKSITTLSPTPAASRSSWTCPTTSTGRRSSTP
jgi:hypothetical protein